MADTTVHSLPDTGALEPVPPLQNWSARFARTTAPDPGGADGDPTD